MSYDGPLCDVHTHVYPDEATRAPFASGYHLNLVGNTGLVADAKEYMEKAGIERLNMLMMCAPSYRYHELTRGITFTATPEAIAADDEARETAVAEMISYNEFGVEQMRADSAFRFSVGLDPALMSPEVMMRELENKHRRGATGVKLVPLDYCITLDDPRHDPIWDYCQTHRLPVTHAPGWPCYYKTTGWRRQFGSPFELAEVYRRFPRLRTCASHLAEASLLAEIGKRYAGIHSDLSAILLNVAKGGMHADELVHDIRRIGVDRVLFGTNLGTMPTQNIHLQAEAFRTLPMTDDELRRIGYDNYSALLG